jgi:protein-tyrosine-phosphatase
MGNVNRSPLCAEVLRQQCPSHEIRSAGFGKSNQRASKKTRDLAKIMGYDLESHRSLQVNQSMFDWADLVIYMDGGNRKRLVDRCWISSKARCLGEWGEPKLHRIPDPAFMRKDSPGFEKAIMTVIECSQRLARWIATQP